MTGLEETFRTILAARLPDDPKWAAWIDGTVAELAGFVPGYPLIEGKCPACGRQSLFRGAGGWVTCGRLECPEPEAASNLLAQGCPEGVS